MPTIETLSPCDLWAGALAVATACAVVFDACRLRDAQDPPLDPERDPTGWTEEDAAMLERITRKHSRT